MVKFKIRILGTIVLDKKNWVATDILFTLFKHFWKHNMYELLVIKSQEDLPWLTKTHTYSLLVLPHKHTKYLCLMLETTPMDGI